MGVSRSKSAAYLFQWRWIFCKWGCNSLNLWHQLTRPPHRRVSGWEFLAVCYHPDKFGDHVHCESGDMFLICHVTSPDHTFKGLHITLWVKAFHGKLPPYQVGGYWLRASGDIKCLIYHVTPPNHVNKGLCNVMYGNSSLYITTLVATSRVTKFGSHRYCENWDLFSFITIPQN